MTKLITLSTEIRNAREEGIVTTIGAGPVLHYGPPLAGEIVSTINGDTLAAERAKREEVLDALEVRRRDVIAAAKLFAASIAARRGTVTSPEVLAAMREAEIDLEGIDPRFMGAVFRAGWVRVGWSTTGSRCRPVPVWKLPEVGA